MNSWPPSLPGLPLPLPAYMTNAVDDACALRDCRSSAGLAQTVSRSLAPRWLGLLGAGRRISRLCAAAAAAVPPDSFLFIVVRSVEPSSLFSHPKSVDGQSYTGINIGHLASGINFLTNQSTFCVNNNRLSGFSKAVNYINIPGV